MTEAIGRALAAACGDQAVLARIGGALGEVARGEARSLAALTAEAARTHRAALHAAARAPIPPGLRGVDASSIEAALAELPARARVVLAEGPLDATEVWLVRRACAGIPPLPPIEPALARPRVPGDVLRLSPASARAWFEQVGLDQLAFALGEHASALGARLAPAIARIARSPRANELGPRRVAIERARSGLPGVFSIGVSAVAPHLEPMLVAGLIRRFPRAEGLRIATDLAADHRTPGPSWGAVIAP